MTPEQLDALKGHTPGPWEPDRQEVRGVQGVGVAFCGDNSTFGKDGYYVISNDEACSNAQLIAAAPDLLAHIDEQQREIERLRTLMKDAYFEGHRDGQMETGAIADWKISDTRAELEEVGDE